MKLGMYELTRSSRSCSPEQRRDSALTPKGSSWLGPSRFTQQPQQTRCALTHLSRASLRRRVSPSERWQSIPIHTLAMPRGRRIRTIPLSVSQRQEPPSTFCYWQNEPAALALFGPWMAPFAQQLATPPARLALRDAGTAANSSHRAQSTSC